LRSLDPPLSEADIERESRSLDEAIRRVEESYATAPEPFPLPDFAELPALKEAVLPPARPAEPPAEPVETASVADTPSDARPRVDTRAPVRGSAGRGRTVMLGAVLALVIAAIAVFAWFLRDTPENMAAQAPVAQAPQAAPAQENGKFDGRVGGAQSPAPTAPVRADVGVAQRAVFYEEDPNNPQVPKAITGRVVWRLETINAGQGQPLETAVRGVIEIPDAGINLNLLLRRNLDATLPASHTVELNFTTRTGDAGRVVRDVGLLQFKNEENARGTPVAGLPVPVRENFFLIGLSNLAGDVERNVELFVRRNWIDLPLRLSDGKRAILSFEKGASGEQVMNDAFRQWQ
jgi:hypothetical protein